LRDSVHGSRWRDGDDNMGWRESVEAEYKDSAFAGSSIGQHALGKRKIAVAPGSAKDSAAGFEARPGYRAVR
jgi:hypothetical protein